MKSFDKSLTDLIAELAELIEMDSNGDIKNQISFVQSPHLALEIIDIIVTTPEEADIPEESLTYSACIFALDICVAQLKSSVDLKNKAASKALNDLMLYLAKLIAEQHQPLSFWLPIMNAFYDAQVELSPELKEAYLNLAYVQEDEIDELSNEDHLAAIQNVINDLSGLSVFDLAENFFAQSYAMPADFFIDLIIDFFNIAEAQDVALLILLHPLSEVRYTALDTFQQLISSIELSSISLSRLQTIQQWYPKKFYEDFNQLLKIQRKKGVVFEKQVPIDIIAVYATEIDGSGAQGLFVHVKNKRKNRICGLLFKQDTGIKEAWVTPTMTGVMIKRYFNEAFDSSITLRKVDINYVQLMVNHFLAVTIDSGNSPNLHLLEIQEILGLSFTPSVLDVQDWLNQLSVQITPFTSEVVQLSLKRSKAWLNNKAFTESWFIENSNVDRLVNQASCFIEGAKVCDFEQAMDKVFNDEIEPNRDHWLFHFLWMALWGYFSLKKNEKLWQDSFLVAYVISTGMPASSIPIMVEICRQTVFNSIETMHERRTHLN